MQDRARKTEFADHLRREQSRIYGYIHSLVRHFDDADDLFQQTTLILWNKFDQYDRSRSFFSWACGVARFEITNFLRSRGRQKLYFTDDLNVMLIETMDGLPVDEMEDRKSALAGCIEKLREGDRELVRRCYHTEEGVNAVADKSGRSSHSVYNSLRRIRRSLYDCIERAIAQKAHTAQNGAGA
jgi:RNA polymerase sigma-70 factor, ECF subfamily